MFSNAGTYKGIIQDAGVSQTRNAKLPQLVVTFLATQVYDPVTEEWQDWSKYGETITGYFVLVTRDKMTDEVKRCLSYDQVMEATGWDGETYSGLAAMDLKGTEVQFRVAEEIYKDQPQMKVNWIAAIDAEMGLRKLSGQDLTNLDTQFNVPVTRKPVVAAKPPVAKSTPTTAKKKGKAKAAPKPPKAVTPPKIQEVPEDIQIEPSTEIDAYDACAAANEAVGSPVPEDILNSYWFDNIKKIGTDVTIDEKTGEMQTGNVTGEEWAKIRDAVLANLEVPF